MSPLAVRVRNADRMITQVRAVPEGIEVEFADGFRGVVPFAAVPEVGGLSRLADMELPNPYVVVLRPTQGETVEVPWDFVRHHCDTSYRPKVEAIGAAGRRAIGARIRQLRERAGLTQEALASAAGLGRVTLVRTENGEQSPRYGTLASLAGALGKPLRELLTGEEAESVEFESTVGSPSARVWLARERPGKDTSMAYQNVLYDKDGKIATITLNRPEKLNAISDGLRNDLEAALREAEFDHDVSVVIIKGAGRAFCAGYDISPGGRLNEAVGGRRGAETDEWRRSIAVDRENLLRSVERWMHMWSIPKPLVAQVHGYCLAGGNEITGCCDVIYAAEDAVFGQPQGRALGIAITTGLWHVRIGPLRTKELLFTGDSISGREAERIGLVNRAVPAASLEREVRSLAERIALTPVEFLAVEKAAVNRYYELMGIKTGAAAGAELDAIFHYSPPAGEFFTIAKERGLKAALEWRDTKFGDARSAKKPVR